MAPKYPSIPEPTLKPESLRDALLSIKQAFEVLTGQRGNQDYRAVLLPELTASDNADDAAIATNAAAIAANAAAIAANAAAIAANAAAIAGNTTAIAGHTTTLATHTTNIATNATNIATNTASIAAHESAWTTYTPSVSITSGAGTATGRYKRIGKTVHIQLHLSVTTGGSIASIGLPAGVTPQALYPDGCFLIGREDASTGIFWLGLIGYPAATVVSPFNYAGAAALTTGWRIDLSGSFEAA